MTGGYKKFPNTAGESSTAAPEEVQARIRNLLERYEAIQNFTLDDILDFHVQFERIHPFQDGNGRIGRLILFKECLRHNIIPFIIGEDQKADYIRGLMDWDNERQILKDVSITAQGRFKTVLDYFRIQY